MLTVVEAATTVKTSTKFLTAKAVQAEYVPVSIILAPFATEVYVLTVTDPGVANVYGFLIEFTVKVKEVPAEAAVATKLLIVIVRAAAADVQEEVALRPVTVQVAVVIVKSAGNVRTRE